MKPAPTNHLLKRQEATAVKTHHLVETFRRNVSTTVRLFYDKGQLVIRIKS